MYKGEPYGLYKYGYVEDLKNIDSDKLFKHYKNILKTSKIDIFVSGDIEKSKAKIYIIKKENFKKLEEREAKIVLLTKKKEQERQVKTVEEKMDLTQGKLVIGLDVGINRS